MSATAHVTVLEHPRMRHVAGPEPIGHADQSPVQLAAFGALALYGVLRWGTMLGPEPVGRLLGLVAFAVGIAALAAFPIVRRWPVAMLLTVVGLLGVLCISGIPVRWVTHVRIAVTGRVIGDGLSGLPDVLVPYVGINQPIREVIVMGAGVLLLDAALVFAIAPRSLGDLRTAVVALPLIVLAIVPSALARPPLPYLHGLILFALLAALVWGERARKAGSVTSFAVVLLAAVGGMILAPALDSHQPWFNFQKLAGTLGPGHGESFDWSQSYGPLHWPRSGHQVLTVRAAIPDYWKAQDLDVFDGYGWTQAAGAGGDPYAGIDPQALAQWTQTLQVTLTDMSTTSVIAAGTAAEPSHIPGVLLPGSSTGTWLSTATLHPGDSYLVRAYTPHPNAAELEAAGTDYSAAPLDDYLTLSVPSFTVRDRGAPVTLPPQPVRFAAFGTPSDWSIDVVNNQPAREVLALSPFRRAYALARSIAARSATPYEYVLGVMRHLAHGYSYNEDPPRSLDPLMSFLFTTHTGYCQQFAGAMALLLRMGGVPARVAVGFTTGAYDKARQQYVVSDVDAHAWVEAWFPHIGWVRFDPTPAVAPARGGRLPLLPAIGHTGPSKPARVAPQRKPEPAPSPNTATPGSHGGGTPTGLILLTLAGAAVLLAVGGLAVRIAAGRHADPLGELERAFARCGRPLGGGATLASLEHRLRFSPEAAGYVRQLRIARFADGAAAPPTASQRRAVREQLAAGGGPIARLRALWALPPLDWPGHPRRRRPQGS